MTGWALQRMKAPGKAPNPQPRVQVSRPVARRIRFAGAIAAKGGDLQQVSGERGPLEARSRSGRVAPVKRTDLPVWRGRPLGAADIATKNMRQPDHPMRARPFASLWSISGLALLGHGNRTS